MNELVTARLVLQPLRPEHADGLFPIWSDSDVVRFTYMHLARDLGACAQGVQNMITAGARREDIGPYAIFLGPALIGMAGAVKLSRETSEYELYYHLGRPWWGHGYATEAASAVVDRIFSMPQLYRMSAEVVAENAPSVHVLEKLGMKREGRLRGKFFRDGVYRDLYVYSMLRKEWKLRKIIETMRLSAPPSVAFGNVSLQAGSN
jgi:ribosomal-protein-alanine N-acetyltransferase